MKRALTCLVLFLALTGAAPGQSRDIQSIAAVVNHEIISVHDLTARIKLVILSSDLEDTPEQRQRLLPVALRTLIDERLQLQEAERLNIRVSDEEVERAFERIQSGNDGAEEDLDNLLARGGVDRSVLAQQIRATIAWGKLVRRRIRPTIDIGEDEVDEAIARIEANKDKPQNLLAEIFLAVDSPEQEEEVRETAERLVTQIRNGASFGALARQFSQSASAALGGDLGWVTLGELDEEVEKVVQKMKPPAMSFPIRTFSGYYIMVLRDRRTPEDTGAGAVRVSLRQIHIPLPPEAGEKDVASQMELARVLRENAASCDDMVKLGAELGSPLSGDLGWIRVGDLPESLRKTVLGLAIGKVSRPMRRPRGIVLLMVCDREEPEALVPDRDQVAEFLLNKRLELMARRYLRDIRRAATVDKRI